MVIIEIKICFCLVDGVYDAWSVWSVCDVTCDGGTRSRSRSCIGPFHGGIDCVGPNHETESCNKHSCPGKHNKSQAYNLVMGCTILQLKAYTHHLTIFSKNCDIEI